MTYAILALALMVQSAEAEPVDAGILEQLAWMEGCWRADGFAGEMSECWMRTQSGELVGAFQYSAQGTLQFTEMLMIGTNAEGEFGYHVKHFNRDFTGWESQNEQVTFDYRQISETRIEFRGLVLEFDGPHAFTARLDMRQRDGSLTTEVFEFSRISP
ncbi:hypothetical protein AWH62_00740 [Maricaulis sp. W15]|uniref:DUF6265 family protein n=1 Tax=Maricaulis sp. W15 TaxID=1772333 RepID=UPI000948B64A|nr:DUF6265 family protein [Maricaulis sp. W15]OLF81234.1 hypothetical protein AWH62_00740 [Maricaulis sp. W15]